MDQLSRWPASSPQPRRQSFQAGELDALPWHRRIHAVCLDNVSSAARREVLDRFPLRDVGFGADREWADRVLMAGLAIEYRPSSRVIDSHDRGAWYELKRIFCDHRALVELFGEPRAPTLSAMLTSLRHESLRLLDVAARGDRLLVRSRYRLRAPTVALARTLGAYLGARAAERCPDGSRWWTTVSRLLEKGV